MSRASSARAARRRDWTAILKAIRDEQAIALQKSPLWTAEMLCAEDYLAALQTAIEGRNQSALLAMLDAGFPVTPVLVPLIAETIRDVTNGLSSGRAVALTLRADEVIRQHFDWLTEHGQTENGKMRIGEARQRIAEERGVSADTIKRSLLRTKPKA